MAGLVRLGVVGAPHGVLGEIRVRLWNPASALLDQPGLDVTLRDPQTRATTRRRVAAARRSGADYVLLALEGVADRDAASALRGAEVCVPREALPPAGKGELYVVDLIGLRARKPDGTTVGTVRDVADYPASQVLVVEVEGGTLEVPMAAPYFVEARVNDGEVVVDAVEDLDLIPETR